VNRNRPVMPMDHSTDAMHAYYSARAPHMAKRLGLAPTGQLSEILQELATHAAGHRVLEVACGTLSQLTVATDFSGAMLAEAISTGIPNVCFV
jgi:ubiquinone/menaquinone biosynthesis C-methylase UbiE